VRYTRTLDVSPFGSVTLVVLDTWTGRTARLKTSADAHGRTPAVIREELWRRAERPLW
jgi:hypothetical protein